MVVARRLPGGYYIAGRPIFAQAAVALLWPVPYHHAL
jgi:hypothetical protein